MFEGYRSLFERHPQSVWRVPAAQRVSRVLVTWACVNTKVRKVATTRSTLEQVRKITLKVFGKSTTDMARNCSSHFFREERFAICGGYHFLIKTLLPPPPYKYPPMTWMRRWKWQGKKWNSSSVIRTWKNLMLTRKIKSIKQIIKKAV